MLIVTVQSEANPQNLHVYRIGQHNSHPGPARSTSLSEHKQQSPIAGPSKVEREDPEPSDNEADAALFLPEDNSPLIAMEEPEDHGEALPEEPTEAVDQQVDQNSMESGVREEAFRLLDEQNVNSIRAMTEELGVEIEPSVEE